MYLSRGRRQGLAVALKSLSLDRYFAQSYSEARRRFRDASASVGAVLENLPLTCGGPDKETLTIDIAWIGGKTPLNVLIHCSGIHGVEGFTGSAIQLRALAEMQPVDTTDAIIFVHVLNPFGMAWLRRVNERNVDLNRNWRQPGTTWTGTPRVYSELSGLLNPAVIRWWDAFYLRAAVAVLKYGMPALRQAIVGGQHEDPKGLFYGGSQLEEGPTRFRDWLRGKVSSIQRLSVIDVHTGLGRWRQNSLFYELQEVQKHELPREIKADIAPAFEKSDVGGYAVRGGHVDLYRQLCPGIPLRFVTQELGTYSGVRVLKALRAENYQHHYGNQDVNHPAKRALKRVFCPPSTDWRASVLDDGLTMFQATRRTAFG